MNLGGAHRHLPALPLVVWVTLAMLAFAGNSLLCRLALKHTRIDPVSFTTLRLVSGAAVLGLIVWLNRRPGTRPSGGTWGSAAALFIYALGFSWAYVAMSAATGALLLFGAVNATMIGWGVWRGERLRPLQTCGAALALAGLFMLLLPGLVTPSPLSAVCMAVAGVAWGVYSIRGKAAGNATEVTAGNFLRTVPMALGLLLVVSVLQLQPLTPDRRGMLLAVASGAVASGLGYAIWYRALPALKATQAATVQLSVPVLAAFGGAVFLGEPLAITTLLTSAAVLGGIALVILHKK